MIGTFSCELRESKLLLSAPEHSLLCREHKLDISLRGQIKWHFSRMLEGADTYEVEVILPARSLTQVRLDICSQGAVER